MSAYDSSFKTSYNTGDKPRQTSLVPFGRFLIYCAMIIACSAYIPTAFSGLSANVLHILSYAIIAIGIAFMFMIVRKLAYSLIVCLFSFYTLYLLPDPTLTAICISAMLIFLLGALAVSACPKRLLFALLAVPALAYLAALITSDPLTALGALVFIPSAAVAGMLQRKGAERKTIITSSTITVIVICIGGAALALYLSGKLDLTSITAIIDSARAQLLDALASMTLRLGEESIELFDPTLLPVAVDATFNVLPGLTVAALFVVFYFFHSVLFSLYKSEDLDLFINAKTSKVRMSTVSAVIFIAAYIFSFTTDSAGQIDIVGTVAENLRLILTPGMMLMGIDALGAIMRRLRLAGFLVILLIIGAFMWLSSYVALILSALGAIYLIVRATDTWATEHYKKNHPRQ